MYPFAYHRATSVDNALATLASAVDGKLLAGGMTLLPTLKQRLASPSDLIDLAGIADLNKITATATVVSIGAMARHAEVAASEAIRNVLPALTQLASLIGDPQVRNMGTIGGSVANNDPAADYPAALLGLGATVVTNRRSITADDFFKGMFETALDAGEMIVRVDFPVPRRAGYEKFRNPASRYATVGVFVAETSGGVRVAVTGAAPCVFRHKDMEAALAKSFSAAAVANIKTPATGLNADIHASADYRAHLVGVITQRAVTKAIG